MLKRKIYDELVAWKSSSNGTTAMMIDGARRVGKSYIAEAFAKAEYKSYILIDFGRAPTDILDLFINDSYDLDLFFAKLAAFYATPLHRRESLIIFDEVQQYPRARQLIKYLVADGRFDYLETGSLIRLKKNVQDIIIPSEEDHIEMFPLDFEEFLWANGITEQVIAFLRQCLQNGTPVPEALHQRMRELLLQYTVVGGMPDAVQTFVDTKRMDEVLQIQRDIIRSYEDDMVKYADKKDKAVIRECFQSIPKQLSKENKKFQYSVVKKGATASKFAGSLQWIEDAGIITRCYNLSITELPLDGNADPDVFKVYMKDTGLFISMLEDGTQFDILQGNLLGYKGAIFEGLIADIFSKMGRKLYYFHKDSGLEVDFIIRYKGECTLVEVKAVSGNTKSAKTILRHPEKYHVYRLIKLGDYNVGHTEQLLTLPLYMAFLLTDM